MDKLERVARAICSAKGVDPDRDSAKGPMQTVQRGNASSYEQAPWPNWKLHETDARVFIAAHAALTEPVAGHVQPQDAAQRSEMDEMMRGIDREF